MFRTLLVMMLILIAARVLAAARQVEAPAEHSAHSRIAVLMDESAALSLPVRVERAFQLTLHAANNALHEGETARAVVLLKTFTFEVRGVKRAKRLEPEAADMLILIAEEAISALDRSR